MVFREVSVIEIGEVLRAWPADMGLRKVCSRLLGAEHEVVISASALAFDTTESERRQLNPAYYQIRTSFPRGRHVMVLDDTWVSGGHAQSVALALKRAGAAKVSILVIARWLDMRDYRTKCVYQTRIEPRPYNPNICPWTGGSCPPS